MATLDQRIDGQIAAMLREANTNSRAVADDLRRKSQLVSARAFALLLLIDWLVDRIKGKP